MGRSIMNNESILVGLKKLEGSTANYSYEHKNSFGFVGEKGAGVSVKLRWDGCDFGHDHDRHTSNPLATGKFSVFNFKNFLWNSTFVLDGTDKPVTAYYSTKGVSGRVEVTAEFKDESGYPVNIVKFNLLVGYFSETLAQLQGSDDIKLVGITDEHPSNHYATPELISKLEELAAENGKAYDRGEFDVVKTKTVKSGSLDKWNLLRKILLITVKAAGKNKFDIKYKEKPKYRQLWVNDMSLECGGRFDIGKDGETKKLIPFVPPHATHMFGEKVDINFTKGRMNPKQEAWFELNATKYCQNVERHGKGDWEHFHCSKSNPN